MNQENTSQVQLRGACDLAHVRITQEHNLPVDGIELKACRGSSYMRHVGPITLRF
ncbi:hypothetical protein [Pseudomonas argentinensis]|uniref:hypothetical protein n=1 Tax=Phytopseudomonas argentinensis TaxID=289370 RepID=UPI00147E0608|nr:hypothetical protein [Pseudomonas argentinensis]